MSELQYVCETCRDWVDENDPDVVKALEQVETRTFGGTQVIDGMGVHFHRGCYPTGTRHYRLLKD